MTQIRLFAVSTLSLIYSRHFLWFGIRIWIDWRKITQL